MTDENTSALLEALRDPAVLIDGRRRVMAANSLARDLFGGLVTGSDLAMSLRHPEVLDAVGAVLAGAPVAGAVIEQAVPVQQTFEMHVASLPSGVSDGARALCLLHDVTAAREVERMRANFVANVSHELRSPLSSLVGFIETLKGPARDDTQARERFLDIMDGEAKRMARLVDDLLSLSRVEAGEHIPPTGAVDISELLAEVMKSVAARAAERGMDITTDLGLDLPPVPGDRDELFEVFHNLLANAVKYGSGNAPVALEAKTLSRMPDVGGPGMAIAVTNQGEVIAPEHLPRLTERFYRIDKGRSRDMGGTGLGLAIVKHIVNHHRGRLSIESSAGRGNRFTVFLPLEERTVAPPRLS
ncbi:MAG: ATP-binding protein [Proteobacteria bacterium]|nr:ATP-binding protein [Pseudomonadota bacterium]